MSDNLKVSGDINTNSLVSTTGNIYKGNSSGATNIWSDSFATAEKAGIIKKDCPTITSMGYEAIRDKADELNSLLVFTSPNVPEEDVPLWIDTDLTDDN